MRLLCRPRTRRILCVRRAGGEGGRAGEVEPPRIIRRCAAPRRRVRPSRCCRRRSRDEREPQEPSEHQARQSGDERRREQPPLGGKSQGAKGGVSRCYIIGYHWDQDVPHYLPLFWSVLSSICLGTALLPSLCPRARQFRQHATQRCGRDVRCGAVYDGGESDVWRGEQAGARRPALKRSSHTVEESSPGPHV